MHSWLKREKPRFVDQFESNWTAAPTCKTNQLACISTGGAAPLLQNLVESEQEGAQINRGD
jgi:hypothetical protein